MTVLSSRHALAAAALMAVAAAPVWLHAAASPTRDDCRDAAAFFGAAEIGGVPVEPAPRWGQAAEGQKGVGGQGALRVRVLRSFEPSRFHLRPVSYGFDGRLHLTGAERRRVEAGDTVLPVHWSSAADPRRVRFEAYLYVQGGAPAWHPLQSGLGLGLPQLLEGTRPVTLLLVSGAASPRGAPEVERAAERWLTAAWQQLEAACGP